MTLALRLGRTLEELDDSMSTAEFALWRAYDEDSPLSDDRGDVLAAHIATTVARSAGNKVKLPDMVLRWGPAKVEKNSKMSNEESLKSFLSSRSAK